MQIGRRACQNWDPGLSWQCGRKMSFVPLVHFLARSGSMQELAARLRSRRRAAIQGAGRIAKGLVASALAQQEGRSLLVVTATLEEAGRWTAQLEGMGWESVQLYPTSEASPYEPFDLEPELVWGQFQVLADCLQGRKGMAIVATERALQPHLPPPQRCFSLSASGWKPARSCRRSSWGSS